MAQIRILPEGVTNQIAAGEVVERPVSVVKELMENALDARARRITVEVSRGGRDLIRVSDDGEGMSRDNALLAIERYATSKITRASDLFAIATLGFRGEALPSMASVSRMTLVTRETSADYGTRLFLSGGKLMAVSETGAPRGTVVEIRDLFFNIPVRRKFLKTVSTEMGHITDAVTAMAMGAPGVGFTLVHNGRLVKKIEADQSPASRAARVLGNDPALPLHPVGLSRDNMALSGYVADPGYTRSGSQRIFLFVNHRMVSDRGMRAALIQGFRGRIMTGRFPMAALFLEIPFNEVDVNVHPAKLQVRFVHEKKVHNLVRSAVEKALKSAETPAGRSPFRDPDRVGEIPEEKTDFAAPPSRKAPARFQERARIQGLFQWGPSGEDTGPAGAGSPDGSENDPPTGPGHPQSAGPADPGDTAAKKGALHRAGPGEPPADGPGSAGISTSQTPGEAPAGDTGKRIFQKRDDDAGGSVVSPDPQSEGPGPPVLPGGGFRVVGQVLGTYIVLETGDRLVLIDQHGAHERIMYEALKRRASNFSPPSQQLVVPEVLDLGHAQGALLAQMIPSLHQLGFEIEPFGGTSFAVKSVPGLIDHTDVRGLIHDMVDDILASGMAWDADGSLTSAWLDECLISMACHRSVRAHQALTPAEMSALVHQLNQCDNAFYCPHGRPIRVTWSARDLEKQFKRMV